MTENNILLLIIGGLGGMQSGPNMLTELQQAHRPNLNALMRKSVCGLLQPAPIGKTPDKKSALPNLLGYGSGRARSFKERYHRTAGLISHDPIYQKKAAAFGVKVHKSEQAVSALFELAEQTAAKYDFLILHIDAAEPFALQKEYYEKIKVIEEIDRHIPRLLPSAQTVICVTGDYSLPTALGRITWHPTPVMIHSQTCRYDTVQMFDEIACIQGGLKTIRAQELMPLLLVHSE